MKVGSMSLRSTIIAQSEQVAKEQKQRLAPLANDVVLLGCGRDSLSFAAIVARIEDQLGFEPFTASEDLEFRVTFADFVRIYEDGT